MRVEERILFYSYFEKQLWLSPQKQKCVISIKTQGPELYIENSWADSREQSVKVERPSQQTISPRFSSQVEENFISQPSNASKIDELILNRPCKLDGIKKGLGGRYKPPSMLALIVCTIHCSTTKRKNKHVKRSLLQCAG